MGSPVVLEVRDDYTFYLKFDEPYGSFLTVLGGTGWFSYADMLKPSHYLKEFHPDYISAERTKELLQERACAMNGSCSNLQIAMPMKPERPSARAFQCCGRGPRREGLGQNCTCNVIRITTRWMGQAGSSLI